MAGAAARPSRISGGTLAAGPIEVAGEDAAPGAVSAAMRV